MKTYKAYGKYDYARRAFSSVDELARYIGKSASYVSSRMTGSEHFTKDEEDMINTAVRFYNTTDTRLMMFRKFVSSLDDEGAKLALTLTETLIGQGYGYVESLVAAKQCAGHFADEVPNATELIKMVDESGIRRTRIKT